jgi:hypothetical protein
MLRVIIFKWDKMVKLEGACEVSRVGKEIRKKKPTLFIMRTLFINKRPTNYLSKFAINTKKLSLGFRVSNSKIQLQLAAAPPLF